MDEHNNIMPPSVDQEGYEKGDVNITKLLIITISMVILLIVAVVIVSQYFISQKEKLIYRAVLEPESTMLRELRAREDHVLNSYKILDEDKGIYQIPIRRAMELIAQEAYQNRNIPDSPREQGE